MSMKKYTVFILCMTVFWLFADQNLMAPNLSAIARDFGFSDKERDEKLGGFIAIGFFIVGVVFLGESFCLGTYWVQTYTQLLICRIMTGISIGGATPIIFSLLGDLYPESRRVYVSTLIGIAMSAGIGAGQLIAGLTGPTYGWRVSFLMVSVPAILCGALVGLTVKEPARGGQEKEVRSLRQQIHQRYGSMSSTSTLRRTTAEPQLQGGNVTFVADFGSASSSDSVKLPTDRTDPPAGPTATAGVGDAESGELASVSTTSSSTTTSTAVRVDYSEKIEWSKLVKLFRTPSVMLIFLQGLPGCLPWGIVYVFLNDYFSADLGLSVAAATGALTCFGVGGVVGQLGGGWWGQRLYDRDARWQCVLMGSTTMLSVLPMIYLLNSGSTAGGGFFYFMAWFAGLLVSINGPNARAVLQNVCSPEVRGCAFAVFMLTDDIGKGLGPAIVVLFIDAFDGDRRAAFSVVTLAWLLCGAMLLLLVFFVNSDELAVQARIRESLLAQSNVLVTDAVHNGEGATGAINTGEGGCGESSSSASKGRVVERALRADSSESGVAGGGGGLHFLRQERGYQSMPQLEEEPGIGSGRRGGEGGVSSQDTASNPLHHRLIPFPPTSLNRSSVFRTKKPKDSQPAASEFPIHFTNVDTENEENAV